jgi:hypothetical protein
LVSWKSLPLREPHISHGGDKTLISSRINRREAISAKEFSSLRLRFLFSRKTQKSNLSWLHKALSSSTTLKERLLNDRSSHTIESELESFREDLPIRHSPVKSSFLHLIFSSSSEVEESSLEKLKSLMAAHVWDMIFWNFFSFLSLKLFFFLLSSLLLELFQLV